jgi:hypothetical protein
LLGLTFVLTDPCDHDRAPHWNHGFPQGKPFKKAILTQFPFFWKTKDRLPLLYAPRTGPDSAREAP